MQLKQIKMRDGLHAAFRQYASSQGILLKQAHEEAVAWFLEHAASADPRYLSSPREGKYRSLWLRPVLSGRVRDLSRRDDVSQNRVIYTSLVLFMDEVKIRQASV